MMRRLTQWRYRFSRGAVLLLSACLPFAVCAAEEEGFTSLFNGKDFSGWKGDTNYWSVENGAITGRITPEKPLDKNIFLVWEDGLVDDFELRLSFRIDSGGNSGIQYRSTILENGEMKGYQADIEDGGGWMGALYDEHGRGPLAERGQKTVIAENGEKKSEQVADKAELLSKIKKDDWNEYAILAQGNRFIQTINGHVTAEAIDNQKSEAERVGALALQLHSGSPMTVQFKDVRIKRLPLKDQKKVVLVAGRPSHAPGDHEHNAGVLLLKSCLANTPEVLAVSYHNGWPNDKTAFANADTILFYMDGGGGHPVIQEDHLKIIGERLKEGAGMLAIHYATEVPKDRGGPEWLDWIGGYYETDYSINPHWLAEIGELPEHPITSGVKPFTIQDEWYFNIRFRKDMKDIFPLIMATPPDDVRRTQAAAEHPGRKEIMSWCVENENGQRGFGFTGAHFHKNWGNDNFRKLVLNAILWTAHIEVPAEGVQSVVTEEDLMKNLDEKPPRRR